MTEKELSKLGEMFLPICEDRKSTFSEKVKKIYYSVNKLREIGTIKPFPNPMTNLKIVKTRILLEKDEIKVDM